MYAAEDRSGIVRLGVVGLATAVYVGLATQGTPVNPAVVTVLGLAWAYILFVYLWRPFDKLPLRPVSYAITTLDSGFIALFIALTGGAESLFYLLWYIEITGVGFRYNYRATLLSAGLFAAAYVAMAAAYGQLESHGLELLVRVGFMFLVAIEVGLLSEEAYQQAEARRRSLKELEVAHERLVELDRLKTRFINTAAHELGTPLTPLKLQLHVLKSQGDAHLTPPQQKAVKVMERNLDRLHLLVQDVLDVARLQNARLSLHPQPLDLAELAREALETFEAPAKEAGIALRLEAPAEGGVALRVNADPHRVTQVFTNLLHNALKFTPAGGAITVTLSREGDGVVTRVSDTGNGLTAEQMAQLFKPFSQVHDTHLQKGGTGLGLYICKGIVEQHGGQAGVESPGPGKGTTFWFRIPADGASAEPTPPSS